MTRPARQTTVEDVLIDLRVQLSADGMADVRLPDDPAGLPHPVLRVPIRTVGSLRLVGPSASHCTPDAQRRLAAFADEIGVAYDEFLLGAPAHRDATWRQARTWIGLGLTAVGVLLVLGAAWALGARALPLSWLPSRPGVWAGTGLTAAGLLVLAGARR